MTTRGNPSISPPVPRQVPTIPGTPPPNQQLFSGQPPPISQHHFDYIATQQQQQGQTLLPYQAYGSAPNDLRVNSAPGGRGGVPQGNLPPAGHYYPPNQNMRPPQPPHNAGQQFYINPQAQGGIRHQRQPAATNQTILMLPHNNNMVISGMYQAPGRLPMYPGNPSYPPYANPAGQMMYYTNSVQRPQHMPMQAPSMSAPKQREKRIITISDPDTGRNITDDVLKSTGAGAQQEDSSVTDKGMEIRKDFTRQVAERMKTGDSAAAQPLADATNQANFTQQPSQQKLIQPQFPQQKQLQQQHQPNQPPAPMPVVCTTSSMVRPHMPATQQPPPMMAGPPHLMNQRPSMVQPPRTPPSSQPRMPINVNLSKPPPQLPNNYYESRPQQNQQPPMMAQMQPVMTGSAQTVIPPPQPQPQPHPHPPQPMSMEASVPRVPAPADSAPSLVDKKPFESLEQSQPVSNIPSRPAAAVAPPAASVSPAAVSVVPTAVSAVPAEAPVSVQKPASAQKQQVESPPVAPIEQVAVAVETQEAKPTEQTSDVTVERKESTPVPEPSPVTVAPSTAPPPESAPTPVPVETQASLPEEVKDAPAAGANIQGSSRDVRKGKKNRKDFNRKDIGGSEMDAFIDRRESIESTPTNVGQMEPEIESTETVSSSLNSTSARDAQENSTPVVSTETSSATEPTPVAVTHPSPEPAVVVEKETPRPATPEIVAVPEKSSPAKDVVEEKNEKEQIDNQKPPKTETDKSGNKPQNETEVKLDNGEPAVEPPTISVVEPVAEVKSSIKENHQSYNDENEPPKEIGKPKGENMKPAEESAKDIDTGSKGKKDGKDSKLQYDRAYLMELRECPSSQTKPDGLPDLDIILDRPVVSVPRITSSAPDFTPTFFQAPQGGQRHAQPIGKVSSRGRQRPGEVMPTQRIIKSVSIQNDLKPLHQSEKPWKPSKTTDDGTDTKKSLEAEVLFIMNRLTPTNFERLADEMKKLNIATYDNLVEVVNIFFEKATMETKFVEAYALLCKIMSPFKVPPPPNMKENQSSFRVVMLTKCQQEFEEDKSVIFENPDEKKKKIEAEHPDTPERTEMIENALYRLKLRRMRFYGNIRFIGELFKLGLLTEKIMHDCIFRLLRARDDDSLVSLCQLLTTVGKELDVERAKQRMDQYFVQMTKIAEERKSRIKFTLMDVIDLRQNHWIPRKEATGPKKIEEVHKDFAQEQARAQFLQSQPLAPRNDTTPQPGSRRGSRQRQEENKMNDDGWNTVGSKNIRMIDASKMKISKNIVDDSIQLGPGGGMMNKQSMWSRGSHGGAHMSQEDKSSAPNNRFSALRNDEDRRNFQRSPSRGDGGPASRGMRQGPTVGHGRGKIITRSSTEGDKREALASARSMLGGGRSQNSSRDNSWNRDDRRMYGPRSSGEREEMTRDVSFRPNNDMRAPAAPPPSKRAPALSRDEMESKAKNILEEYLNIRDLAEAKLCVQELSGQQLLHALVSSSINDVLERNDQARINTGQYLYELLQAKLISLECYLKGLGEVLEFAEDMIIDIPKLWTYLAQTITPILAGSFLTLHQVKTAVATYLSNKNGAILLSHVISLLTEKLGEEKVAKEASGLGWETFLKPEEVETFLEDRKIGFLLRSSSAAPGGPAASTPSSGVSTEQVAADLENLIRSDASNSNLTVFIETLPAKEDREKNIVRALMTAIGNAARSDSNMVEELIKKRKDVLTKTIGPKIDLQLQALYSIQALMTQLEHPRGVMDRFFTALYDEDVIDLEAFGKWYKSSDPQEQLGKGVSVLQLNQFFTYLKEDGLQLS